MVCARDARGRPSRTPWTARLFAELEGVLLVHESCANDPRTRRLAVARRQSVELSEAAQRKSGKWTRPGVACPGISCCRFYVATRSG